MIEKIEKAKEIYTRIVVGISAVICMIILLTYLGNVCIRYFTKWAFKYTEDITVIGMLWIMCLGLSVGWINREHLVINVIDKFLHARGMKILNLFLDILGVVGGIVITYFSFLSKKFNTGFVQSVIGFDESFRYWPLIVGGILLSITSLASVVSTVLVWKEGKNDN